MTARSIGKALALLMMCALFCASLAVRADGEAAADEALSGAPAPDTPAEASEPRPARAYVMVSTATQVGWLALPEEGEVSYPLTQTLPDGTLAVNVIHLTPEGVYMEDATCENHDCVGQGMVTLENRDERILSNMIICLPNQVYLQLLTPEEVLEMMKE